MKLTSETKFFLGIIVFSLVLVGVAITAFSRPPKPVDQTRLIPPADLTATGSAQAKTILVEFSDYQCPSCRTFAPVVKKIIEQHPNDLYFVYRHYPLPQHPQAVLAASAAEAAGRQGKYWQMHEILFQNQDVLAPEKYQEYAKLLNLDLNKFNQDATSSAVADKIDRDLADGNALNINETPTFFLNGLKLTLTSTADLSKAVDNAAKQAATSSQ